MSRWLRPMLTLILVTSLGFFFDRYLFSEGLPRWEIVLFANFDVGVLAAVLVALLEERASQRNRLIEARLHVISEMNHHIRNALQVILFHSASAPNEEAVKEMKESIARIQWALREILPSLPER